MKLPTVKVDNMKALLDQAIDGFSQIVVHEANSIDRHLLALRARVSVARKARGIGELLRDQIDLLPATQLQLMDDHRARVTLWRQLRSRIASSV